MTHATDLKTFAAWMASEFSNKAQHDLNPPFFAYIRVCMRPLPQPPFETGVGLLIEQAYDYMLSQPYRIRVLRLYVRGDRLGIENYTIKDPERFFGASREPGRDRLQTLTAADIELMNGCNMGVDWSGSSFKGSVDPGKACMVFRKDRQTYLDSTFEVTDGNLQSWERGRDPQTDEHVWGSVAGPFQFSRLQSFAPEVIAR